MNYAVEVNVGWACKHNTIEAWAQSICNGNVFYIFLEVEKSRDQAKQISNGVYVTDSFIDCFEIKLQQKIISAFTTHHYNIQV